MTLDLTANGRLEVGPLVNERRFLHLSESMKASRARGYAGERAQTDLKETLTTSDALPTYAHIVNFRNLEEYDKAENIWSLIADTDEADDFKPVTFYNYAINFNQLKYGKDNDGQQIAPLVAEADTYQHAFGYTEEDAFISLEKRGFKTGFTLEQMVNDMRRLVTRFPADMLTVAQETDEYVVIRALNEGVTSGTAMQGGVDYVTGETVPANATPSAAAVRVELRNIGLREVNGNKVGLANQYHVVVGIGEGDALQWDLDVARNMTAIQQGYTGNDRTLSGSLPATGLGRIGRVLESEYVPTGRWYLVPAKGATRRPSLVKMNLRGYTMPEVYVSNYNGIPVAGGASSSPFTAFSFDNDSLEFKLRMFTSAGLITQDQLAWSDGSGN